jgi:hypothetical protein
VFALDICRVGVGSMLSFSERERDCLLVQHQASTDLNNLDITLILLVHAAILSYSQNSSTTSIVDQRAGVPSSSRAKTDSYLPQQDDMP